MHVDVATVCRTSVRIDCTPTLCTARIAIAANCLPVVPVSPTVALQLQATSLLCAFTYDSVLSPMTTAVQFNAQQQSLDHHYH
jgi:hypothetical protein